MFLSRTHCGTGRRMDAGRGAEWSDGGWCVDLDPGSLRADYRLVAAPSSPPAALPAALLLAASGRGLLASG